MPAESWVLNGLILTSGTFSLMELTADPPRSRADWISAADSESAALMRQPLHENRTITMKLRVTAQASMDNALDKVGLLVDKLRAASATPDGIDLVWTPNGSTRSRTFDVLAGEITGLPISLSGDGYLWLVNSPVITIELTCKPYWRGTETLTSTTSSSTPFVTMEITGVTGDIPALGRLIITDTASQSRRHVEWGLEGPLTYNASTSLLIDSDDMVTSGFGGSQSTQSGAYDPNASGNNVILAVARTTPTAMCGTGNLSHVGAFRVKGRFYVSPGTSVRFVWQAGDGPVSSNPWVVTPGAAGWAELDLGQITVPAVVSGTQRWTGRVEIKTSSSTNNTYLDYLVLVPLADGYGKARAAYSYSAGALVGFDDFNSTTSGASLGTRAAPAGGSWAGSGDTPDFAFQDGFVIGDSLESINRVNSGPETTGRFAILGTTNYTDMEVSVLAWITTTVSGTNEASVIARWVDSSNYLRLRTAFTFNTGTTYIEQVVAGSVTVLASSSWQFGSSAYRYRLLAYTSGQAIGQVLNTASTVITELRGNSSALATGGTLDDGKPGLLDRNTSASAFTRRYTSFAVSTPTIEPIVLYSGRNMQVRYDDVIRQDSTGTYTGRPQSYRGSRFLVPVGTSRVLVKARRNDIEAAPDDNVTDATQIQVGWTPRGLAVPR